MNIVDSGQLSCSMALSMSSKTECGNNLDASFGLCCMSLVVFFASSAIAIVKKAVLHGFAVLMMLRSCWPLTSDHFLAPHAIIMLGVVTVNVLAHLFGREATLFLWRVTIFCTCVKLLLFSFGTILLCGVFLTVIYHKTFRLEEELSAALNCRSVFSKRRFHCLSDFSSNYFDLPLAF